jgi:hypothetical protein
MDETKTAIIEASELPISIIIIGVGKDEFKKMKTLDSDKKLLKNNAGNKAKRDIVQFVRYYDFKNNPAALTESVL